MTQSNITELIKEINEKILILEKFVDTNDMEVRELLNDLHLTVNNIKNIVYGNPTLRLEGQADRVQALERMVREIIVSRKAERDRLKGILYGLGITSITSLSTLITVIVQAIQ